MFAEELSRAQARRVALAAQGFAEDRPTGRIDRRHLRRLLDRMGVIQIDSVNVLVRSQELPLFARLGPHQRSLIFDATQAGDLYEYWVHEASHADIRHHHLHRWRVRRSHHWKIEVDRPGYVEAVYRRIAEGGPVVSGELSERVGRKGPWWDWDDAKSALELLFWQGRLAATRRPQDFARVYDLAERVIPADVLARPTPPESEARKALLELAGRYLGVATIDDLADYHRQKVTPCKPLVAELVEEGALRPVRVEGWGKPAYLHREARLPRRVDACALLSPFDPLCWYRDRALRLFGFHYRIEIYTPAAQRRYGYYVLPVLHGDTLVGRLDLKAERAAGELHVRAAHVEPGSEAGAWAGRVAGELASMAAWLGLGRVVVADRGDAAPSLAAAVDTPANRQPIDPADAGR